MRTIAIINAKGGVGKTTSALVVADILSREYKKRVLVTWIPSLIPPDRWGCILRAGFVWRTCWWTRPWRHAL